MPTLSAPELRRKKAERIDEFKRLNADYTKDGATPTEEQLTQLNAIFSEIEVGGSFDRQIKAAEMFAMADGIEARGRESAGRQTDPLPHEDPTNTRKGKHQYSMLKAIREAAGWGEKPSMGQYGLTGLEAEVDAELRKQRSAAGRPPRGIMIPNNLTVDLYASRMWAKASGMVPGGAESFAYTGTELATTVESTTTGAGSIPTILGNMIDILRARMVTVAMGARVMEGMQGLFALPRQSSTTTAYWVNEGQDVTQSAIQVDQVPFTPHTVGVRTPYTRRFLEQTNVSAENFIREDHVAVKAREIERAGLNGTGSSGQPLGIMQNPLIPLIAAGANGAAPTFANLVAMETTLATANADIGSLGYVTDAAVRGLLKTTPKIGSTFPVYLWDNGMVNEYKVGITNLLPTNLTHGSGTALHAAIFGNWSDMIYAFWSGDDVIVNPYSADASGSVIITTLQDVDVEVRHPESFVKMMDILTS
jgi:HK97 family phage major capsid protein